MSGLQGPTGPTGSIGPTGPSGPNAFSYGTVAFGAGAVLADGTVVISLHQEYASHILLAAYNNGTGGGSTSLTVEIDGTPITGLSAITVNTAGSANASGANAVAAGSHTVELVFASTSGTISDGGAVTLSGTFD